VSGLGAIKILAFYDVQPDSPLVQAGIPTLLPLLLDTNIDDKDLQVSEWVGDWVREAWRRKDGVSIKGGGWWG